MKPFTFKRNRVGRIYTGGLLIDKLQGAPKPVDGYKPEEWLASTVRACNDGGTNPMEGVSVAVAAGKEIPFTELAEREAEALFGAEHVARHGRIPGFLTKLLDSAIRLPLQAHPDLEAAKKLYNSKFGKTEAWIVLDGRYDGPEKPYVMLGFNERLDEEVFRAESLVGDMPRSLEMTHKHYVKPGDVMILRGGVPHAIGPGNFILEIMEPSDWVVQPENICGDRRLSMADRFGFVEPKAALDVFHYKGASKEETWRKAALAPKTLASGKGFELLCLIDRTKIKFFGALKLKLSGEWRWERSLAPFAVGVVVKGSCALACGSLKLEFSQGDCFFLPASAGEIVFSGDAELVFALGPA